MIKIYLCKSLSCLVFLYFIVTYGAVDLMTSSNQSDVKRRKSAIVKKNYVPVNSSFCREK